VREAELEMSSPPPELPPPPGSLLRWSRYREIRASDADRDRAVAELTEHHMQGRLDSDELGQRTQLAYSAKTRGELIRLLSDLPGPGPVSVWEAMRGLRPTGPFPGLGYAGFWPRAGALCADTLVTGGAVYGLQLLVPTGPGSALVGILPFAYFVALWATTGQTVGMWLVGVRVVRQEDGHRLGFGRSLIRLVGYMVNTATCFAGFAWAAVDRRKQGWHDKMAGSYVVRRLH
jgi:uncharacterized RDD family membrane protein YckC